MSWWPFPRWSPSSWTSSAASPVATTSPRPWWRASRRWAATRPSSHWWSAWKADRWASLPRRVTLPFLGQFRLVMTRQFQQFQQHEYQVSTSTHHSTYFIIFPHQTICMAQGRPTTSRKFNLPANLKYVCPIAGKICKVTNKSIKRLSWTRILQGCSEAGLLEIGLRY